MKPDCFLKSYLGEGVNKDRLSKNYLNKYGKN